MKIFSNTKDKKDKSDLHDLPGPPPPRRWFLLVRMALFLGIIAVLSVFGILSFWPEKGGQQLIAALGERVGLSVPDLVNLRIIGQDGEGRPYIITAQSAKPKETSLFRGVMMQQGQLKGVEANLDMGNEESWMSIRSPVGEFDSSRRHLRVGPGFALYSSAGYQMHGRSASFDLKTGLIIVEGKVNGWGPLGEIVAASLESRDMGEHLRFYGGVEVVLRPSDKSKSSRNKTLKNKNAERK